MPASSVSSVNLILLEDSEMPRDFVKLKIMLLSVTRTVSSSVEAGASTYRVHYLTVIYSFIFSNFLVPIPLTFIISVMSLNPPLDSRYEIILSAVTSPTPGS